MRASVIKLPENNQLLEEGVLPQDKVVETLLNRCDEATTEMIEQDLDVDEKKYYTLIDRIVYFMEIKDITPTRMAYDTDGQILNFKDRLINSIYYFYDDPRMIKNRLRQWRDKDNRMIKEIVITLQLKLKEIKQEEINRRFKKNNIEPFGRRI